ncbi:MAG: hypothetical protein R3C28_10850 [Pirellulaceae bacterium]
MLPKAISDSPFQLGPYSFTSCLIAGFGRQQTGEEMAECRWLSAAECITVAVRRERLYDSKGHNILDFIDLDRYCLLPNTAGCYTVEDAVRTARLGREDPQLEQSWCNLLKLEPGDGKTLLPNPMATIEATEQLVQEGFFRPVLYHG